MNKKPRKKPAQHEHDEQVRIFRWARKMADTNQYPELYMMFAVPNGGKRNIIVGKRQKDAGLRSGVPDLCLPVPRNGHHGLFIELKVGKSKLTDHQRIWLDRLTQQGYLAVKCVGADEAIDLIEKYLGGKTR